MKCSMCGSENSGTKFCTSCGARLYDDNDTSSPVTGNAVDSGSAGFGSDDPGTDASNGISQGIEEVEASAVQAAEDLNNTASEAFHTMAGDTGSDNSNNTDSGSSGSYDTGSAGTADSSNYYDAGYQGGYSYNDGYTEGGGYIGFSIASLICGIISMVCCICSCANLPLCIAAIVLGIITLTKHYDGKGMAIAGLITGGLGLILGLVMLGGYLSDGEIRNSVDEVFDL